VRANEAAKVARNAAKDKGQDYLQLSAMMCWDGVVECQVKAGAPKPAAIQSNNFEHVISLKDPAVTGVDEMRRVPEGAFIGFFDGTKLIHAMISTGAGLAAGNKNACLAIGNPVGWELLDLGNLVVWGAGGGATTRNVQVRYRELK
jgi:hypothetical protein